MVGGIGFRIAYLVVWWRDDYKIWCLPRAVKKKRGRNKHFANCTFCGTFQGNKTTCLSLLVAGEGHSSNRSTDNLQECPSPTTHKPASQCAGKVCPLPTTRHPCLPERTYF